VDQLIVCNLLGDTIVSGRVFWRKTLAEPSAPQFLHRVKNTTIKDIRRRGKCVVLEVSGPHTLLIRLRMTGRLYPGGPDHLPQKYEKPRHRVGRQPFAAKQGVGACRLHTPPVGMGMPTYENPRLSVWGCRSA